MKKKMVKGLGILGIIFTAFILFGVTFGTLFFAGVIGVIAGLVYIVRLSRYSDRKLIRFIRNIYILGFVLLIASFMVIEGVVWLNMDDAMIDEEVDYVVVLGAGLNGEKVSNRLEERLQKALAYIQDHQETKIIVSGGQGKDELISEAEAMKRYMIENEIEPQIIISEDQSTSTVENIKYTIRILEKRNESNATILLVTSDYHLYRSKMIAKELGMNTIGISSKSPMFIRMNYMIREYFAVIKEWIYLKII